MGFDPGRKLALTPGFSTQIGDLGLKIGTFNPDLPGHTIETKAHPQN
jgi:hypothetical protein